MIFVSHNLDQVAEVCERVMWLERGRVTRGQQSAGRLIAFVTMTRGWSRVVGAVSFGWSEVSPVPGWAP